MVVFEGVCVCVCMGVSKNRSTPKLSILIGFSIINHPFWGTPIFGNIHIFIYRERKRERERERESETSLSPSKFLPPSMASCVLSKTSLDFVAVDCPSAFDSFFTFVFAVAFHNAWHVPFEPRKPGVPYFP